MVTGAELGSEPAYPLPAPLNLDGFFGLSKRELIAMHVMAHREFLRTLSPVHASIDALAYTDALLAELAKEHSDER
ncbi:MAG: hypothetical protein V3V96_16440 [Acidiferrobacterales bacterium]